MKHNPDFQIWCLWARLGCWYICTNLSLVCFSLALWRARRSSLSQAVSRVTVSSLSLAPPLCSLNVSGGSSTPLAKPQPVSAHPPQPHKSMQLCVDALFLLVWFYVFSSHHQFHVSHLYCWSLSSRPWTLTFLSWANSPHLESEIPPVTSRPRQGSTKLLAAACSCLQLLAV